VITAVTLPCVSDLSPDNSGAIGKAVTKLRMERGWTLRELAEKMGSTNPTISRKESGQISIKPPERRAFAAAFGMSLDEFDSHWRSSVIPQSKVSPGIAVINRAPAGGIIEMEECGTDSAQGFEYLDRDSDTQADLLFAVIITGDSMQPALYSGDYAIFHPLDRERARPSQPKLNDGDIVFVRFSAEYKEPGCTVARYFADGDRIRLHKDNPRYQGVTVDRRFVEQLAPAIQFRSKRGLGLAR